MTVGDPAVPPVGNPIHNGTTRPVVCERMKLDRGCRQQGHDSVSASPGACDPSDPGSDDVRDGRVPPNRRVPRHCDLVLLATAKRLQPKVCGTSSRSRPSFGDPGAAQLSARSWTLWDFSCTPCLPGRRCGRPETPGSFSEMSKSIRLGTGHLGPAIFRRRHDRLSCGRLQAIRLRLRHPGRWGEILCSVPSDRERGNDAIVPRDLAIDNVLDHLGDRPGDRDGCSQCAIRRYVSKAREIGSNQLVRTFYAFTMNSSSGASSSSPSIPGTSAGGNRATGSASSRLSGFVDPPRQFGGQAGPSTCNCAALGASWRRTGGYLAAS